MIPYQYVKWDIQRFNIKLLPMNIIKALFVSRALKYVFWLRFATHENILMSVFSRIMHHHYLNSHQIQIPLESDVVMSPNNITCKICNLNHCLSIGPNHGKAETIGSNAHIGHSYSFLEIVHGDTTTSGAVSAAIEIFSADAIVAGSSVCVVNYNAPVQDMYNRVSR